MSKPFQLPMFFSEVLLARDLASQVIEPDSLMSVISGLKWLDWYASQGLDVLWLRMFLEACQAGLSMLYVTTWKLKNTPAGRSYFQLVYSVRPTNDTEFSLWPTPSASDNRSRQPAKKIIRTKNGTYRAINKNGGQSQMRISQVVKMWGTPTRSTYKATANFGKPSHSHDVRMGNLKGQVVDSPEAGIYINPDWEELLMGLPIGWTDLTPLKISPVFPLVRVTSNTPLSRPVQSRIRRHLIKIEFRRLVMQSSGSRRFRS